MNEQKQTKELRSAQQELGPSDYVESSVHGSKKQPVELSDGAQRSTKQRMKTRGGKRGRPSKQVEVVSTTPVQESSRA